MESIKMGQQIVLVAGASSGMGKVTTELLAANGYYPRLSIREIWVTMRGTYSSGIPNGYH
jgi:NADP-dependent 3-hydroxy acid dehydrogenase YdfG